MQGDFVRMPEIEDGGDPQVGHPGGVLVGQRQLVGPVDQAGAQRAAVGGAVPGAGQVAEVVGGGEPEQLLAERRVGGS